MKKIVVILALLVSVVSFSKAQPPAGGGGGFGGGQQGTPEERAQRTIDGQSLASFNLTADQKTKTLALLTKLNKSLDSLTATVPADGDRMAAMQAMAPKRTAITEGYEKVFISWLTPDQKKAYDTALAAAKERNPSATTILGGRGRGGQGGGGQGGGGGFGGQGGGGGGGGARPPQGTPPAN